MNLYISQYDDLFGKSSIDDKSETKKSRKNKRKKTDDDIEQKEIKDDSKNQSFREKLKERAAGLKLNLDKIITEKNATLPQFGPINSLINPSYTNLDPCMNSFRINFGEDNKDNQINDQIGLFSSPSNLNYKQIVSAYVSQPLVSADNIIKDNITSSNYINYHPSEAALIYSPRLSFSRRPQCNGGQQVLSPKLN